MVIYICSRCNKVYENKFKYTQHVNRKFPCKQIESLTKENKSPIEFICNYCNKNCSTKSNLSRHINLYCKTKKLHDNDKTEIELLREKNKELEDKLKQKQHIYNTSNTISLWPHGQEEFFDSDKIQIEKDIRNAYLRGNSCIQYIVEKIHFDDNKPCYKNIFIPSQSRPYAKIHDGISWILVNKHKAIHDLCYDKFKLLNDNFTDNNDKLTDKEIKLFKKFQSMFDTTTFNSSDDSDSDVFHSDVTLKQKYEDRTKLINLICNDLKMLLYNKKHLINKHI